MPVAKQQLPAAPSSSATLASSTATVGFVVRL